MDNKQTEDWIAGNCKFAQGEPRHWPSGEPGKEHPFEPPQAKTGAERLSEQCSTANRVTHDLWNVLMENGETELAKEAANVYASLATLIQKIKSKIPQ